MTAGSRTTGGGLLLHLSLPPPPPPGSARGPPPQHHLLVDQLRTQLQRNNPGLKLDWVRPTGDLCPAEQDSRFRAPNGEPLHWPATKIGEWGGRKLHGQRNTYIVDLVKRVNDPFFFIFLRCAIQYMGYNCKKCLLCNSNPSNRFFSDYLIERK